MFKKSCSYALAASAIAAVFLALSPVTAPTASAQAAPAAQKQKKSDLEISVENAFKLANDKKYADAIKAFKEIKNGKYKEYLAENKEASAELDYQIAACTIANKDWEAAETVLLSFIEDYPNSDKLTEARLSLVSCYIQLKNWEGARQTVDKILKWLETHPNSELRMKAAVARVELLQEEGKAKDEAGQTPPEGVESFEKLALATGAKNLYDLTNNNIWTPAMISARQQLIAIYNKLGRKSEGKALKAKVDAYLSGDAGALDPASQIRSNMQNLEVGDDYFQQAQELDADNPEESAKRIELFRQALQIYQGVMRKEALMKCFAPALEKANAELSKAKKDGGETPDEKAQKKIDKATETVEELEDYKKSFDENKDFDALISFRIGASLLSLDRPWEAFVAFGDILTNHKDFALLSTANYYYILTLHMMGRDADAQAECKKYIETYKGDKEKGEEVGRVALMLGQISFDQGEYKDAIEQLEWVKSNVAKLPIDVECQIDWFIISANFSRSPWGILTDEEKEYIKGMGKQGYKPKLSKEAEKTLERIEKFLEKYGKNTDFAPVVEEMLYRKALLYFYTTMLPETKAAFEAYIDRFPEGYFIPDARYRLAVVQNGIRPPQTKDVVSRCENWIKDYFDVTDQTVLDTQNIPKMREDVSPNIADSVQNQLPEVYTLLADANKSLAEAVKGSDIRKGIGNKKIEKFTQSDLNKKKKFMDASISAYILAAKTSRNNPDALYFTMMELDKQLPQLEDGYARLLDVYDTLYNWDPNSDDALNYLFKKIDFTVRKARSEANKMDRELRAAHIAAAEDETRKIMAEAILKNINNPRQDGVETLLTELAQRFASKVKFHRKPKEGEELPPDDPNEYTAEKAIADLTELLNMKDEANATLIARARASYAKALIYDAVALSRSRDFDKFCSERDRIYRSIANSFNANELSPTILSMVGTFLAEKGETAKAETFFQYVLDFYKGSETAEYSFAGLGKILFDRKEYKKAFEVFNEGIEGNVAYGLEADLRLGRAKTLIEMSSDDAAALNINNRLDSATTELNYIKGTKEWRGAATAESLYYLGRIKESNRQYEAAVGDYRICYLTWKKYPEFAAKAMLRVGLILRDHLGQQDEAKTLFLQMTDEGSRYRNTPEAKEAEKQLQTM